MKYLIIISFLTLLSGANAYAASSQNYSIKDGNMSGAGTSSSSSFSNTGSANTLYGSGMQSSGYAIGEIASGISSSSRTLNQTSSSGSVKRKEDEKTMLFSRVTEPSPKYQGTAVAKSRQLETPVQSSIKIAQDHIRNITFFAKPIINDVDINKIIKKEISKEEEFIINKVLKNQDKRKNTVITRLIPAIFILFGVSLIHHFLLKSQVR